MQSQRGIFLSQVVRRRRLCREHFEITVEVESFPSCSPGQFVQILCRHEPMAVAAGAMLRRPFSIGGLRQSAGRAELDIIGRVIGPGTAWLDARREGDIIDLLGPLGQPFSMPERDQCALLVAGGVGLPPIQWMCEILREMGHSCEFFFGAQSRDLIPFELIGEPNTEGAPTACTTGRLGVPAAITTDDGSAGWRGRVTQALSARLDRSARDGQTLRVYACGPEAMLKAVAEECATRGVSCEVAMERVMGCGMGTCQSCVIPVRDSTGGMRYALCCREGPVFDSTKVVWAGG